MAAALEAALAPAPAREIGEWVHSVAGEALDWRQELVHRIESETSSSMPPPLRLDSPASPIEVSSGVVPTEGDLARAEAPTVTNELRNPFGGPPDDERQTLLATGKRTRSPLPSLEETGTDPGVADGGHIGGLGRVGLAALLLAGLMLLGGGVLFGLRWMQMSNEAGNAGPEPSASASKTPSESESAIVIGGVQRTPPGGSTGTSATTTPTSTAASASARPVAVPFASVRPRTPVPTAPVHDECENPMTVDARGIKHPKPQCFTKK